MAEMIVEYLKVFFHEVLSIHPRRMTTPHLYAAMDQFEAGAKKAMRLIWYPTLYWLRNTRELRVTSQRPPYTREADEIWKLAITNWKAAGEYLGLDESDSSVQNPTVYAHEPNTDSQLGWSPRSCAWRLCLCYGEPVHRMRVCKGCWRAHYCTKQCQAK